MCDDNVIEGGICPPEAGQSDFDHHGCNFWASVVNGILANAHTLVEVKFVARHSRPCNNFEWGRSSTCTNQVRGNLVIGLSQLHCLDSPFAIAY